MSSLGRPPLWTVVLGFPVAILLLAMGWGLIDRAETGFGTVWAAFFVVVGVVLLVADVALLRERSPRPAPAVRDTRSGGEPARFLPRRTDARWRAGLVALILLGGWALVMGVVGALEENWLWLVIGGLCAIYLLGVPVLAATGRFRTGGVLLTPTRVVDEHFGRRTEIAYAQVETAFDALGDVNVVAADPAAVQHRRLTPRLWGSKIVPGEFRFPAEDVSGGAAALAAEIRERAVAARSRR